jgi:rhodanese-related sulfurtransferase
MHGVPTVAIDQVPDPLPSGLHILDVREEAEWRHGHIDGAAHIPLSELPGRLAAVPEERTLVVCRIGGRSAWAVAYLRQRGHDAVNLEGGMVDWEAAGRPIVSETGDPPKVV